jgi:hypothetical protein
MVASLQEGSNQAHNWLLHHTTDRQQPIRVEQHNPQGPAAAGAQMPGIQACDYLESTVIIQSASSELAPVPASEEYG